MQEKFYALLSEDHTSTIILLIIILIGVLLYLIRGYKKSLKSKELLLIEKDEKIKSLRQYSYEMELKRVEREHEVEKEFLRLKHLIKELEKKEKEGLKSQVVTKLEEYQKRRAQQLKRVNLSL